MYNDLDLTVILLEEMRKLEFSEASIAAISNTTYFKDAVGKQPQFQRTLLSYVINEIFVNGPYIVPNNIRLSLCMPGDSIEWVTELKLVLLPFLKSNESSFFHVQP